MSDRIPVKQLVDLLPDLVEFDPLRQALRKASSPDTTGRWDGRWAYSTIDHRVISLSFIGTALMDAENEVRRRLKRLYDAANIAFSAIVTGSPVEKSRELIVLGEASEAAEYWREALAYYLLAYNVARDSNDLQLRALVERRVGRTALNVGDFPRALHFYSNGLATASMASDIEGQWIAATGLGNIAALQGRWTEADEWFVRALSLSENFPRERGQLLLNRSVGARELKKFIEAEMYLNQARLLWDELSDADHVAWYNNLGLLQLDQGNLDDAKESFDSALDHDPGYFERSMVLDNLSEVAVQRGNLQGAMALVREAEEFATAHGSPRALAEIYMQMGRIARLRRDSNGVAFFDKALDITRDKPFPLLIGEIHYEFGLFRKEFGELSSAREHWHKALAIFAELGASTFITLVESQIAD